MLIHIFIYKCLKILIIQWEDGFYSGTICYAWFEWHNKSEWLNLIISIIAVIFTNNLYDRKQHLYLLLTYWSNNIGYVCPQDMLQLMVELTVIRLSIYYLLNDRLDTFGRLTLQSSFWPVLTIKPATANMEKATISAGFTLNPYLLTLMAKVKVVGKP